MADTLASNWPGLAGTVGACEATGHFRPVKTLPAPRSAAAGAKVKRSGTEVSARKGTRAACAWGQGRTASRNFCLDDQMWWCGLVNFCYAGFLRQRE